VTHSKTGVSNVIDLLEEAKPCELDIEVIYVTRSYLTRHGAGPLPNEMKEKPYKNITDLTNIQNEFQGVLRFAPLDIDLLSENIENGCDEMKKESSPPLRRITLRDIAKDTGFSINTISHALKDKEDISEKTRQLIQQRAKEMGYIADSIAGSLRSGSTRTISVIVGDISNPHFGLWVREIETTAFKHGYSTLIINTNEDEDVEREAVVTAISKRVDGIIICPTQKPNGCIELLRSSGIPFVLIGRRFDGTDIDCVVLDDVQGGYIATQHLLNKGHRNVLFLNGPSHISSSRRPWAVRGTCSAIPASARIPICTRSGFPSIHGKSRSRSQTGPLF
jgi:transcriptional regulator with XRE-family HTH domain